MLVLSRKQGEKLMIGSDITLTVVEVNGNRVRIGIDAPSHITILRTELVIDWSPPPVRPGLDLLAELPVPPTT